MSLFVRLAAAAAALAVGLSAGASTGQAALVGDNVISESFPDGGNSCPGYFSEGSGFSNCVLSHPGTETQLSPVLAKWDSEDGLDDVNENESVGVFNVFYDEEDQIWRWTYTPEEGDLLVSYVSIKQGSGFTVFWDHGGDPGGLCGASPYSLECWQLAQPVFSGEWGAGDSTGDGWSHITFWDSDPPVPVPLPAGLMLFLTGLAGIGFLGRNKSKRREFASG